MTSRKFTGVYKKSGSWYAGWVEEVPGVNTQGKTLAEAKRNLKEALELVLETNRIMQERAIGKSKSFIIRESLSVYT